jgi:hypothetical protein
MALALGRLARRVVRLAGADDRRMEKGYIHRHIHRHHI